MPRLIAGLLTLLIGLAGVSPVLGIPLPSTPYVHDGAGREVSRSWQRTNAQGQTETLSQTRKYDAEGREIEATDALGGLTTTQYNAAGKVSQVTDPLGRITRHDYDAQARLIRTTWPDGTHETCEYDAEGNEIARTDRAGRPHHPHHLRRP